MSSFIQLFQSGCLSGLGARCLSEQGRYRPCPHGALDLITEIPIMGSSQRCTQNIRLSSFEKRDSEVFYCQYECQHIK